MASFAPRRLRDLHCHLDWVADPLAHAAACHGLGIGLLCCPVTPGDSVRARGLLAGAPNVRVAVGLHPWWVADAGCPDAPAAASPAEEAARLARDARYVGEVGLDFSPAHVGTAEAQVGALDAILRACAESPRAGRVVSLHAVRSAGTVLDLLERHGLARDAVCIFHWFSGTSEELARARRLGCRFSVGERMLATRRGRAYARQLPEGSLLLETDLPAAPGARLTAAEHAASLGRALDALALVRGDVPERLADVLAANAEPLF